MKITRIVIVGTLFVATVAAPARSFEFQLLQLGQNLSAAARQNGRALAASSARLAVQAQAVWQKVTGPDGTFTAEMPGTPAYQQATTPAGQATHSYLLEQDGRAFIIQTAVFPSSVDTSNPKANLQGGLDNAAKNMEGGKYISVTWKTHQGLVAVDSVGRRNGREFRAFSMMRGQQIFVMIHAGPDGTSRSDEAIRFFASLNIR